MSEATVPRVDAAVAVEDALRLLEAHGVLLVEGAMDLDGLRRLDAELEPWFARARCGSGPFYGRRTRRFSGLFAKAPATADLALHPLVLPLAERILQGPDPDAPRCDAVELNLTQAIAIGPGEPAQVPHRDDEVWPVRAGFEVLGNAMWCLDDFTPENGATRVVPGSHLWPRERMAEPGEFVAVEGRAGSAILWLGGVLHGGGANRTTAARRGVVISYRAGWLAPMERLLLSTPPQVARRLPERLQQLLGYQLHRPGLGWVEGRDPLDWLHGRTGPVAAADDNLLDAQAARLEAHGAGVAA